VLSTDYDRHKLIALIAGVCLQQLVDSEAEEIAPFSEKNDNDNDEFNERRTNAIKKLEKKNSE